MRIPRSATPVLLAAALTVGLVGCSTPAAPPATPEASEPAPTPEETTAAPSGDGDAASFAKPVTTPGELLGSASGDGFTVDVYQVGTAAASKTGQFANPDTQQPIIAVGDDIVFVNYVVSNTGDPIDLGFSLVSISARYDDWPYIQGMDSVVDFDLFEQIGVNRDPFGPDTYRDPGVYTFGSGERYSYGENFPYQAGSPIQFEVSVTPVDAEGDLLHDEGLDGSGSGTIN